MNKTKKVVAVCFSAFIVTVMSITLAVTAQNNVSADITAKQTDTIGCNGSVRLCYSLIRDSEGNIVNRDIFEQNLDKAIADGTIPGSERSYYMEMYDYCSVNDAGCGRGRGMSQGGCGMGRGWQ